MALSLGWGHSGAPLSVTVRVDLHSEQRETKGLPKTKASGCIFKMQKENDENKEGPCSLGCIVISFCQRCNNVHCFMIFYCILLVSQGIIFGLVNLSIDHFEKDYNQKTSETLALSLTYDVSSCLLAVFISYYGGRGNIPKWIAISSILIGMGAILFSYPYFTVRNYQLKREIEDICQASKFTNICQEGPPLFHSKYTTFFIFGLIVQGIAGLPLYILGKIYIDDNTDKYSSGIYLGFGEASTMTGFALGTALGALQIQITVNRTLKNVSIRSRNMLWMWNWWIAFFLAAFIAWSTLIPLSCFPQNMSGSTKKKAEKRKHPDWNYSNVEHQDYGTNIKDLIASILLMIKQPVFMCLALSRAAEYLLVIGVAEFLPKYIENQYELSHKVASILAGVVLLPGGSIGQILGGVIISKLKLTCKAIMRFVIVTSIVTLILLVFIIFIRCEPVHFAGITENYEGTGQLGNLTAPCNAQCECSTSYYSPICGRDDIEYFSPCFAGCKISKAFELQKFYYNCSCVTKGLLSQDEEGDFSDAELRKCDSNCYKLPLFIAFIFATIVFASFSSMPIIVAILRIAAEKQRPLALGIAFMIMRIFGTIPGPLLIKKAGEMSCAFYGTGICERPRICHLYNKTKMVNLLVGICK
ncbi:PREDICTED: solute carrier organic anion transporter family member 6A1-like [Chrysochloris asiatica]|uniref:Solute carrier organic anion transporter family member n=1 Tax=Chrysochloris asiatica TaxID=185453 RepID=A0A9B0U4D4_CHRAS|nr:PREDICTED: solute carrier organic anion transporter family member 6A1-like [Chrysochloris asiatica]